MKERRAFRSLKGTECEVTKVAITSFIPTVWSARLLNHLEKTHVYDALFDKQCSEEVADYGDTVKINGLNPVTIADYTKNGTLQEPEQLTTAAQTLTIDQGKSFHFYVDDVDAAQARAELMDTAMRSAAYGLADAQDQYLAKVLSQAVGTITANLGTDSAPISISNGNAYDLLVDMKVALDQANVPMEGRCVIVPPQFAGCMLKDSRFASAYGMQAQTRLENGTVGYAAGFEIRVSNNVPNTSGTKYKIMAGYSGTAALAEQIVKTEAYRPEKRFADAVKGLHVYGAMVTRPGTLAVATVKFAAKE